MSTQRNMMLVSDIGELGLSADVCVNDLRLDSRSVENGDIFFAVSPDAKQRAQHIEQAVNRGCSAILVESVTQNHAYGAVPVIAIENLRSRLGRIAHEFYGKPSSSLCVIGITGTNGKTSCSHWIAQAFSRVAGLSAFMGTLGSAIVKEGDNCANVEASGLTTADVVSNHRLLERFLSSGVKNVAMEVSSHALEQGRVDGIEFDTAVFTSLSRDHLDYHGDMAGYGKVKQRLFMRPELNHAIVNIDDEFGKKLQTLIRRKNDHVSLVSYALSDSQADVYAVSNAITRSGITANIRTPWGDGELRCNSLGEFNLLNAMAVLAVLCSNGVCFEYALNTIEQLHAVSGRAEIVSDQDDEILVLVDFAHTPDALQKILKAVRAQAGRLWCVFGCGGNRDTGKRAKMGSIAEDLADIVVVTDDNPRYERSQDIIDEIISGFKRKKYYMEQDRSRAIEFAIGEAMPGDTVVIAGKGHEEYQEVAGERMPFSDQENARLALKKRKQRKYHEDVNT